MVYGKRKQYGTLLYIYGMYYNVYLVVQTLGMEGRNCSNIPTLPYTTKQSVQQRLTILYGHPLLPEN